MNCSRLFLIPLMVATLAGCTSLGPGSVARDRFDYNEALAESWKRQILLNIVKMRYAEPIFFMDVGQIVAGYSLESGVTMSATVGAIGNIPDTWSVNPSLASRYTDRPTITYVPLTGHAFIKSLMSPLPPESLMSAIQSGVPADMIFNLGVASINGLRNRPAPVAGFRPAEPQYLRVVEIIRNLQNSGVIRVKTIKSKDSGIKTVISFASKGYPNEIPEQLRELQNLLGLDQSADQYVLTYGGVPENNREIAVQSFSLMHLLSFLAARVEVPAEEVNEGRASHGVSSGNTDRENKMAFSVKCSSSKPSDSFAAVRYNSHWFWIDNRDMASKRTLSFILLVFTLAETGRREALPQITIPAQ